MEDRHMSGYIQLDVAAYHKDIDLEFERLSLQSLLERHNPYLIRNRRIYVVGDLIRWLLDDYLDSLEQDILVAYLSRAEEFTGEFAYLSWRESPDVINKYGPKVNLLAREFSDKFCHEQGFIEWDKVAEFALSQTARR